MRTLALSAALALAGLAPAQAQEVNAGGAQGILAQEFVNQAGSGGLFEVSSSELALQRSQDEGIRAFAETMIRDHTANSGDLAAMATNQGLLIPDKLGPPHAAMLEEIEAASGADFDAAYARNQVAAHEAAVALYGSYAEGGDNDLLIGYARESLPVLQQHLEHAQGLAAQ